MFIEYVHCSELKRKKLINSLSMKVRDDAFAHAVFSVQESHGSQEEYDAWLLQKLEYDKKRGVIFAYNVILQT